MPTTAVCRPSGNGGLRGVPSTKWRSGTWMGSGRPGSASSGATMRVFEPRRNMPTQYGQALPCYDLPLLVAVRPGHRLEQLERGGLGGRDEDLAPEVLELGEEAGVDGDLVVARVFEHDHGAAAGLALRSLLAAER